MTLEQSPLEPPTEEYWQALLDQGEFSAPLAEGSFEGDFVRGDLHGDAAPGHVAGRRFVFDRSVAPNGSGTGSASVRDDLWSELESWYTERRTFVAPVIGCNKGGLLVRIGDGIGFLPASQLKDLPCSLGTDELRSDLEQLVGREVTLRLIELDRSRNRVICSERAALWNDDAVDAQLDELENKIGDEIEGTVRSLCDFGAFIDLGNIDGLVHISELSWQRVGHPAEVLEVGQEVRVRVLSVDRTARRVGLSMKRLEPNPWPRVYEHYAVGSVIDATVTNVVDFGAFASVEEGVEGLIHISEMSDEPFVHPREVVSEGERVRVRVLHVDPESRRLGLSMRQA